MSPSIRAARAAADALALFAAGKPVERAALVGFEGWGSMAPALAPEPEGSWREIAQTIAELPTGDGILSAGGEVVDTSFFTPKSVVERVYDLLQATGCAGGKIAELGCGTGRFFEYAPFAADFVGVESDPLCASIARHLHPAAHIIEGRLERVPLASDFDAVVGNVPFSQSRVWDAGFGVSMPIHQYFMRRAGRMLRPGGVAVLVTSRYVMDGRVDWAGEADFLGAVRLPSGAFAQSGTETVADIVVLRRPVDATVAAWPTYEPGSTTSAYWQDNPGHVAGVMQVARFRDLVTVESADIDSDIAAAVSVLGAKIRDSFLVKQTAGDIDHLPVEDAEGRAEGSFHFVDDRMVQIVDGAAVPVSRASKELRALVDLRVLAEALLEAETDEYCSPEHRESTRQATLDCYTKYVQQFGALNRGTLVEGKPDADSGLPSYSWRRPPMGGFRRDPGYYMVMALEQFDQDSGRAGPAPILLRHINVTPPKIERVDTPAEALAVSLGESGLVDTVRIGELLNAPAEAVPDILQDLVYFDPKLRRWEPASAYLSGDVPSKIATATAAGLERNVAALRDVLPEQLTAAEVRVSLGVPWVSADDVAAFGTEVLGMSYCRVEYDPATGTWDVDGSHVSGNSLNQWGTSRIQPEAVLQHALDGSMPIVYDEVGEWHERRKVRNPDATLAAADRLQAMQEKFATWVWEDGERAQRILDTYNRRFRSHAPRVYDGSHLTFPGMSSEFALWPHQRRMIERIVSSERNLCAHAVGAGKTLTFIAAAMTLRRFGLARKPLIVVPNHLLEQVAREARQAFPTARFLIAQKEDLAKAGRRLFAARCATGEWDAVVMTQQAFTSLPVSAEREAAWVQRQVDELMDQSRLSGIGQYSGGRAAKTLARMRRSMTNRIEQLRSSVADPEQVKFEQLGIDYLLVDEAHAFKRLQSSSRNDGFSLGASKRATDLSMKIDLLETQKPAAPIVTLFTGTPWSNTIAETYVWQRYLQPSRLQKAGVEHFDAWAATFVQFETRIEISPDGATFRLASRPTSVQNLPELMGMLGEIADIITSEQLLLPRPSATVENVIASATPAQSTFVRSLAKRAEKLRSGGSTLDDGRKDNMLLICSEGRACALDPALVGVGSGSPKVAAAASKIAAIYAETKDIAYGQHPTPGALQVVFCDLGTPHPGDAQTYGRLRSALVTLGVPNDRIRWVHEAKTARARQALFEQCLDGRVSVLMGSTEKLGTGTNVQDRLIAVHHLDAPWRPSDITQREGRAIRPGNLNARVQIFRYVTEGTFDSFMWQTLERKARFIDQLLASGTEAREASDIGDMQLSFGEVKAVASGNPLLLEQAEAAQNVKRLRTLAAVHRQGINRTRQDAVLLRNRAERLVKQLAVLDATLHGWPSRDTVSVEDLRQHFVSWNPKLRVRLDGSQMTVSYGYATADTIDLPRIAGRTARFETAAELANEWRATLQERIAALRPKPEQFEAEAARLNREADTMRFDRIGELRSAEAHLSRIEAALTEEATPVAA